MFGRLWSTVRGLLARGRARRELDEELRFHVEMETQAHIDAGLDPVEARRVALRDFGGIDQTREAVGDVRAMGLDDVVRDVSHACRRLRRNPGVTVSALLTISLSVGLATAVYSVAAAVLLNPFPYQQPDRLLSVWRTLEDVDFVPLAIADLLELRDRTTSLAGVAGVERHGFALMTDGATEWADAFRVTPNLFDVLGVRAALGRTFRPDEERAGHDRVVIISERFWRQVFGGDFRVIGRRVSLKGEGSGAAPAESYEVVGVVSADLEFFYPTRVRADLYVPRSATAADHTEAGHSSPSLFTIVRAAPSATLVRAAAEIRAALLSESRAQPGLPLSHMGVRVVPLQEELVGRTRPAFLLLTGAALVLLVIGSINVANLLLVVGLRRAPEMATRLALGCSRSRLFRQLLTENLVLTAAGGILGVVLAFWVTPLLKQLAPATIPRVESIGVNLTALVFAVLATASFAVAVAVIPALIVSRPRADWVRHLPTRATSGRRGPLMSGALVVAETALMIALFGAASLITHSTWRLGRIELGFEPAGVLVASLVIPERLGSPAPRTNLEYELLRAIRAMPGVEQASIASELPFTWGVLGAVIDPKTDTTHRALVTEADGDYVSLLRIPLREGRLLTADDSGNRHVALVNDTLARRLSANAAIGLPIRIDDDVREVVGVVGDVTEVGAVTGGVIRRPGLGRVTLPAAYVPLGTTNPSHAFLLVRTVLPPARAFIALGQRMRTIDPELAIRRPGSLDERVVAARAETRFSAVIVSVFAVVALVLSIVGLYGVLAHSVSQRMPEFGIRVALGATPRQIRWSVAGRAFGLVGIGAVIGVGLWWLSGHAVRQFLFEVAPSDPWALGIAGSVLATGAIVATWWPAQRASRVNPTVALRSE